MGRFSFHVVEDKPSQENTSFDVRIFGAYIYVHNFSYCIVVERVTGRIWIALNGALFIPV